MRSMFWCSVLLVISAAGHTQTGEVYAGFTLERSRALHASWTSDNWDDGGEISRYTWLNMIEFWPHSVIDRGGPVRRLPPTVRQDVANFIAKTELGDMRLAEYVHRTTLDGVIVLHEGRIVFEAYPRMFEHEKHIYMSISKAFTATMIAILEDRGLLDVTKPVDEYLPELAGSGWEGVSLLDVLDMASGIGCLEGEEGAYENPETCYYQFEAGLGWVEPTEATPDDIYAYVAGMTSHRPAGEAFEYTSPNTFVLGWLIERVSGRRYVEFLESEIWQRMGAESDAFITAPKRGIPIAHAGMSSTLRDVARFGLLFTPTGRIVTAPVISDAYLDRIQHGGRPAIFNAGREDDPRTVDGEPALHNSRQWDWVMPDGDFFKGGYGGQGLYISPSRDLVVAFFGTMNEDGSGHSMTGIARQLAKSGLFELPR